MNPLRIAACLLLLPTAPCCNAQDAEQSPLTDEALLEGLGAELLKPSSDKPPAPLDERLIEEFGEDLGEGEAKQKKEPLTQVVGHMRTAQTLLERSDRSGSASSAQTEALDGLDAMIAELTQRKSQCSGGKGNKPGSSKSGKKPSSSGKTGTSPAQSATGTTSSGADLSTELAVAGELVKDLWGQLPQRQLEQILQPLSEGFLPKYASDIEAYFRALADPERAGLESP